MADRITPVLITFLLIAILAAGCGQKASPQVQETPSVTTEPATPPPDTPLMAPLTIASPEPFPSALSLGTSYRYGRDDIAMEVAVYRVRVMDEYEWWSPQWGKYYNTTPKAGNHFLFAFVLLIDRGTARARLPSPSMFVLHGDGGSYLQATDRDNSLRIKGIDVKQYDFSFENTGGWIDPGESNKVDGFLLYEVPVSIMPDHAYLEATFSSQAAAVWKLG